MFRLGGLASDPYHKLGWGTTIKFHPARNKMVQADIPGLDCLMPFWGESKPASIFVPINIVHVIFHLPYNKYCLNFKHNQVVHKNCTTIRRLLKKIIENSVNCEFKEQNGSHFGEIS